MENVRLTNHHSSQKSKVKRLTNHISSNASIRHVPQMSENSLKRWEEARDTYLGDQYSYIKKHREIKSKSKSSKLTHEDSVSIFSIEPYRFSRTDQFQTIYEHVDDKCIGTDINESILNIEQIDEAIQADLSLSENLNEIEDEKKEQEKPIEYNDKATETDFILNIKIENEVDQQPIKENTIESIPQIQNQIESNNDDDDRKTILSSSESSMSISEQFLRLRHRFKRLSKERRLISCLLALYVFIMFALLVVILILLWAYQDRSLILTREAKIINNNLITGVARYGESCKADNDCKRPFTCYKRSSSSGICRCPFNYNIVNNRCIGDLNALCTKDTDCSRYMLCSGMDDGTRRCHCQTSYNYDTDRKQCRGDYHALCENNHDCRANLICNKTMNLSLCSCQLNYRYYPLVKKCRGDPGAICEQTTAECIDNAECRDGACECAFQFIPNAKKICVDPCPKVALNRVKIRYPGDCRRFIDCQYRTKNECPDMTIFNFRTQLCDYRKNVLDCR